jgi:itaconyl-CoA hydratase
MTFHPRSMLFVSGEKTERFAKAMAAGADLVCIDLEDAVHPGLKAQARAQVLAWLAENRYRESFGRYYEDFVVGDVYEHRPGRTVITSSNVYENRQHLVHAADDEHAPAALRRRIRQGTASSAVHRGQPLHGGAAGGHERHRRQPEGHRQPGLDRHLDDRPVFAGDTLYAETEVLDKRESASRPNAGIVTVRTTGTNQHGTRSSAPSTAPSWWPSRATAVEDKAGY